MSDPTTITCEEALRLLAEYLDGELYGVAHAGMERHLEICRSCFSRAEFERRLKTRLASLADESLTPSFEKRIRSIMERFPG